MSHFAVMIIHHQDENIADLLQPYHQFECTGTDDQYVIDIDITDDVRSKYDENTELMVIDPSGVMFSAYENRFYRKATAQEKKDSVHTTSIRRDDRTYEDCVRFIPEGWTERDVPIKEIKSMSGFIRDYYNYNLIVHGTVAESKETRYGYAVVDDTGDVIKVIKRTNPNSHWDWWKIGGRFGGKLIVKNGTDAKRGEAGLGGRYDDDGNDVARIGDLDIAAMHERNIRKLEEHYRREFESAGKNVCDFNHFDKWNAAIKTRKDALSRISKLYEDDGKKIAYADFINKKKEEGNADAEFIRLTDKMNMGYWSGIEEPLEDAIASTVPLTAFAVIKDGQWYEKGEMGWWGMVHNEQDQTEWNKKIAELLASSDPYMMVSIVDCHI